MSFSNQVKQELVRELPDKECCRRAELAALVHVNGQVIPMDGERLKLVVRAEQAGTARKIYTLIKSLYGLETTAHSKTLRRFKKTRIYEVHAIINKDAELWKKLQGFSTSSTRKDTSRPISYAGTAASAPICAGCFEQGFYQPP